MPRLVNTCILATIVVLLFVSFSAFLHSPNTSLLPHSDDDSLQGAFDQASPKNTPPVSTVHDPPMEDEKPPKKEEPKKEEQPKEEPKKEQESKDDNKKIIFPEEVKSFHVPDDITYAKEGPKPDQIVMLAAGDGKGHHGGIPDMLGRTTVNRKEYAEYHGYHYHFINITKYDIKGIKPMWAKLPALLDTFNEFPNAQWIWWLDSDAIIMTPDIDLNSYILSHSALSNRLERGVKIISSGAIKSDLVSSTEPDVNLIDVIISQDHNGLNTGSFFLRRSTFTRMLIDFWSDPKILYANWQGGEQDGLLHLVTHHPTVREHVGFVPQRAVNSYAVGGDNMGWKTGDLVVHFAGCWVDNKCKERFEDFWSRRTTVEMMKKQKAEKGN
ncbi:galactosyl transferase GMA12/MNN10 family-domain-containing protein [Kalaharituber pfeilii]|nr:galactosyl transferase GMA12/MNN10 family-domain-containing protein [Kalaharituber pfeilii]